MIEYGRETCADWQTASKLEWLETNGIGGFASGTIAGANTRRYHGWLVAAVTPPTSRCILLSKFEETLIINGKSFDLSANQYPEAVFPNGYKYLTGFRLAPFPIWTFAIENIEIEKSLFLVHGENTVAIEYKFASANNFTAELELKPLVAFRDFHSLRTTQSDFETNFHASENSIFIKPIVNLPALELTFSDTKIEKTGFWYNNFEYERERERGFDFRENLFQPFALKFKISGANTQVAVVASSEKRCADEIGKLRQAEILRRKKLIEIAGFEDEVLQDLTIAADQFIVSRGDEKTVIAGYHWFSDWGRDTMIALPGLTLATNRFSICKSVLLEFSRFVSEGMLPNRFPDTGGETPEYNTVDAALWYFEAVRAYLEKTSDFNFVKDNLYEKLVEIIVWHLRGTRYNIHVDTDGLLCAGNAVTQLTWMDAKAGNAVFTPRYGKAVEIQALWYNALCVASDLAERFGDDSGKKQYDAMAEAAKLSFLQTFWNREENCLFDCVNGERDGSIRPNQIFAVSLHYSMLPPEKARQVLQKVEQELFTPFGLRTLSPRDEKYCPRYEGDAFQRDAAYHQGTVWAWLAGAFFDAYAKVFGDAPETNEKMKSALAPFKRHLREAGIGQISEIFDADAPHAPRGCIAQAWSVAEILRIAAKVF
jgi:predicted glycogen debranching enzyme